VSQRRCNLHILQKCLDTIFIFASFCEVAYTLDVYELITVDSLFADVFGGVSTMVEREGQYMLNLYLSNSNVMRSSD
jgi:ribulose 1,5-bisphosphate carboxylase large subunit-like protein